MSEVSGPASELVHELSDRENVFEFASLTYLPLNLTTTKKTKRGYTHVHLLSENDPSI